MASMIPSTGNQDLRLQLHIDGIDGKFLKDIANLINDALLEPMSSYQPVNCSPPFEVDSKVSQLSDAIVFSMLLNVKIYSLRIPRGVARWTCDFLINREQRIKLSRDCFSEWGHVPSGIPPGTKRGPWLFISMINEVNPPSVSSWKYIDDTTLPEVVPKGTTTFPHSK